MNSLPSLTPLNNEFERFLPTRATLHPLRSKFKGKQINEEPLNAATTVCPNP
jgi:hypothetical protein